MKTILIIIANSVLLYFLAGFVFGIYFLLIGAPRIDPLLKNSKWAVRILLLPGVIAAWPFFLRKMINPGETGIMNNQLLKVHRYVWIAIVIIMPIVLFLCIRDVDFSNKNFSNIQSQQLPSTTENLIANTDKLSVQLLEAENTLIMVLNLKTPFKNPSTNLYILQNGTKGKFLGQLNSIGIYRFDLSKVPEGIICYDTIKDEIITKIEF